MGRRPTRPSVSGEQPSILVLNVGSSTLKFALFPVADTDDALLRGAVEYSESTVTRASAVAQLLERLKANSLFASIQSVGHRLVHGGPRFRGPVRIDAQVRASLDEVIPLAPEHLPTELCAIDEVSRVAPSLPQIACFDTAFHASLPTVARLFGLPRELTNSGVARYGFHGLSYEYVVQALRLRGELPRRTVVAHLGNGASITALLDGVSVDTSMGLTPTGGVVMGTRSGDLDPGVLLYLLRSRGFSATALDDAVNHRGGLLGISETSGDVRELLEAAPRDSRADDALAVFCYQVKKVIGGYAAALGGIDALVFTGGIGEHSPEMRERICGGLEFLGIELDAARNSGNAATISTAGARVTVRRVETNEEAMIARHARRLIA
jgi:acetate kinase